MPFGQFLSNLTDWSKLPPIILFALTIVCGLFLFGGIGFFKTLGLEAIQTEFRPYFGFGFLLFGALFLSFPVVNISKWIFDWLEREYKQGKSKKQTKEWLSKITDEQKIILRSFMKKKSRTMSLNIEDGFVKELEIAEIIYLPSATLFFDRYKLDGMYTDYNMQP